jgi:hypothetical protein
MVLLRGYFGLVLVLLLVTEAPAHAAQTLPVTLTAPDSAEGDRFGEAVAVDGDFIVVGSPGRKAVDIYQRSGAYVTTLTPLDAGGEAFGSVVDISGDTIVIGAHEDGGFAGAVYVSTYDGSSWSQPVKLVPAGLEAGDNFGHAVAIDGDTFAAGAHGDDEQGGSAGAVYVYERENGVWSQADKLYGSDPIV